MSYGISTGLVHAILNAAFNAGAGSIFDSAICEGRTGTRPADANNAPVGTVIFAATLPADAFASAASLAIAISAAFSDSSADATGVPTWFRIRLPGDLGTTNTTDARLDGDVGEGSGDMSFDNTDINAGQAITVNTFTISLPKS